MITQKVSNVVRVAQLLFYCFAFLFGKSEWVKQHLLLSLFLRMLCTVVLVVGGIIVLANPVVAFPVPVVRVIIALIGLGMLCLGILVVISLFDALRGGHR